MEIIAVIAVACVLLALSVGVLAGLLKTDAGARRQMDLTSHANRLGRQFVADVHAARRVQIPPDAGDAAHCELSMDDGKLVRYEPVDEGVRRSVHSGGNVVGEELFALGDGQRAGWRQAGSSPRLITLSIDAPVGQELSARQPWLQFDARLGADHRFAPAVED